MKKLLQIIFFCTSVICYSQTKEKLIKTIEKANIVESDCIGSGCMEGKQYLNFQKLKKQLTKKELLGLTKVKSPVLRSYAYREVIQPNKKNVVDFLVFELEKQESALTYEGCSQEEELVSSIVYNEYWNKIRLDALQKIKSDNEAEQDIAIQKRLESDEVMEKLDSVIIHTDNNTYWLLYLRTFENRKHKDSYIPRIEKLAFEKNNSFALLYLNKYYPIQSKQKIRAYFENEFKNMTFEQDNNYFYFEELITFLLKSDDSKFTEIAIEKLKKDRSVWKNNYQIKELLEKRNIKL